MGSSGLEPPTSRLSGARSNLLSYEPIVFRTVCHWFFSLCSPFGGDDGIRTHDPLLAGQVLSQLSYTPVLFRVSGYLLFEQSLKIEQQEDTETSSLSWVFLSVKPFFTAYAFAFPFLPIFIQTSCRRWIRWLGLSRNKVAVSEGAAGSPPFYGEPLVWMKIGRNGNAKAYAVKNGFTDRKTQTKDEISYK